MVGCGIGRCMYLCVHAFVLTNKRIPMSPKDSSKNSKLIIIGSPFTLSIAGGEALERFHAVYIHDFYNMHQSVSCVVHVNHLLCLQLDILHAIF